MAVLLISKDYIFTFGRTDESVSYIEVNLLDTSSTKRTTIFNRKQLLTKYNH